MLDLQPYEVSSPLVPLELGDLSIPRYGCLTVAETIAFDRFIQSEAIAVIEAAGPNTEALADSYLQLVLCTLLLISRHSPTWTIASVKEALTPEQIARGGEFMLGEKRRWAELSELPPAEPTGKPAIALDWARLRLRLQLAYPGEDLFRRENFGGCPLILIEQALEELRERDLNQAHNAATPIAMLGVYLLSAQGCKDPKPEWINPYQRILNQREAKALINPEAARTFLELTARGRVPNWALEVIALDQVRLAAA